MHYLLTIGICRVVNNNSPFSNYDNCLLFLAVSFLEYWKRKQASLAHHWDVMDFEEDEVGTNQSLIIIT